MNFTNRAKYFLMRKLQNKLIRNYIAEKQAKAIGIEEYNLADSTMNEEPFSIADIVKKINAMGFYTMKYRLSVPTIASIIEQSQKLKCLDPYNKIYDFNLNNIPEKTHVANFYSSDLMQIPEIVRLANDPFLLNIASQFLGCKPTLSSINMWWSVPGKKNAAAAQNFHRDIDDFKFIKVFFYLTDVDQESGPHVYVRGSSQSKHYRKEGRFSDEEIESLFGKENIIYFTEPKGSIFIVDTYGIHKGLLPNGKERLLLQFEYSINPIFAYNYSKVSPIVENYDKYVNRLYY